MPSYAVVYSTVSCMLRRVVADDDGQVTIGTMPGNPSVGAVICTHPGKPSTYLPLASGESAFNMPVSGTAGGAGTPAQWKAAIKTKTGVTPPDLVCALVDSGNIVRGLIAADPAVDISPDVNLTMVLAYSPLITIGCSYDPGTGLFTTVGGTLPPHTPGNATDQPIDVPPTVIPKG